MVYYFVEYEDGGVAMEYLSHSEQETEALGATLAGAHTIDEVIAALTAAGS